MMLFECMCVCVCVCVYVCVRVCMCDFELQYVMLAYCDACTVCRMFYFSDEINYAVIFNLEERMRGKGIQTHTNTYT